MNSFSIIALFVASCLLGSQAAPVYEAPAPAHGGYGHAPAGPVAVHTYAAKAPAVKCGANLLVGCAPHVAHVPCVPSHSHGGYAPAPSHGYAPAPAPSHGYAPAPSHGYAPAPAPSHGYAAPAPAYGGHGGYRASDDDNE